MNEETRSAKAKVAFLGLGIMGAAMAANLARSGQHVRAWNRTPDRPQLAELAVAADLKICGSIAEAVSDARYIFICVSDVADLEEVLFADGGVLAAAAPGSLVIDTTTTGQKAARQAAERLAKAGIRFVDAPVTGGDVGARQATLTVLVGGSDSDFAEVKPILDCVGRNIVHCGPVGDGQAVKLCNQILCAVNMVAVSEALILAEELGVDKKLIVEALAGGAGGSWALSNLGPRILKSDFGPGFMLKHMLKDLRLIEENLTASEVSLPGFELARELFERAGRADAQIGERQGTQSMIKAYRNGKTTVRGA